MQWSEWLQLFEELYRVRHGVATISKQTGEDCWREYFDDDYSPADALDDHDSYGENPGDS